MGNSNGIVWAIENTGPAVLHAYLASDLTHQLYNSSQAPDGRDTFGNGNKFITNLTIKNAEHDRALYEGHSRCGEAKDLLLTTVR
jgi:hypothetical protein